MASSLHNANATWRERRGVWLVLDDEAGHRGHGEASPLPGYSPETLEQAVHALTSGTTATLTLPDDATLEDIGRAVAERIGPDVPSARFALETALADLLAQRQGVPLARWLSQNVADAIPVAAVIAAEPREVALAEAREATRQGIGTLKMKVGRAGRFDDELALLASLRRELGRGVHLRVDANGAFPSESTRERLEALAGLDIELCEEPTGWTELTALGPLPGPVALDESVRHPNFWHRFDSWPHADACVAIVVKPAVLGGLLGARHHASEARRRGLDVIVSHLFDGPIALSACVALALADASRTRASGLAPHGALLAYPRLASPRPDSGRIVAPTLPGLGCASEDA